MRHGIIGCGRVSTNHAVATTAAGVEIASVCDLSLGKAEDLASRFDIPHHTKNAQDIFDDQTISSVSICTDHGSHAKLCLEALRAKKHVIVEKPMAISSVDAKEMISEAARHNRVLGVVSQQRFNPIINACAELVQSGALGSISLASGFLQCNKSEAYYRDSGWRGTLEHEGGSALINQAIHTLDLMVWLLGPPVCFGTLIDRRKFAELISTEDTLVSILRFPNGSLGTLSASTCSTLHWDSYIELVGTRGSLSFTTGFPVHIRRLELPSDELSLWTEKFSRLEEAQSNAVPPTLSYYGISHNDQLADFFFIDSEW